MMSLPSTNQAPSFSQQSPILLPTMPQAQGNEPMKPVKDTVHRFPPCCCSLTKHDIFSSAMRADETSGQMWQHHMLQEFPSSAYSQNIKLLNLRLSIYKLILRKAPCKRSFTKAFQ
ncbi:hypothetical protein ILYODFUR_026988 [Ilyodon furcidens]|uniref:Uncharacterized protein n=1 Tax=Ilyodon furcidens TaxID=33524 RepID=A0ABV0SPK6_9TELE